MPESPVMLTLENDCCIHCGACLSWCKRTAGKTDASVCADCLLCYQICPRLHRKQWSPSPEQPLGDYRSVWQVRRREPRAGMQNAGFVTALAEHLLRSGQADGVLLTSRDMHWHPRSFVATDPDEVQTAAGSKYTVNPLLADLQKTVARFRRLAVVGLPCQMAALHRLPQWKKGDAGSGNVLFKIGLFCMTCFHYGEAGQNGLIGTIAQKAGTAIPQVEKMEILKGKLIVHCRGTERPFVEGIKAFREAMWPICLDCPDYTARYTDLSVGSAGADFGANTVLVRTETGERLFQELLAGELFSTEEMTDVAPLMKAATMKMERSGKASPEEQAFRRIKTVRGNWFRFLDQRSDPAE